MSFDQEPDDPHWECGLAHDIDQKRIAVLEAEIARLREALERIYNGDNDPLLDERRAGNIRSRHEEWVFRDRETARAALARKEEKV